MSISEFQFHEHAIRELRLGVPRTYGEIAAAGELNDRSFYTELQRFLMREEVVGPNASEDRPDGSLVRVHAELRLVLRLRWVGDEELIALHVVTDGWFSSPTSMDPDARAQMYSVNAPALLYSQLRPVIRVLAAEAGHPGFNLPLMNVAEMFRDQPLERWPKQEVIE
jgi:hypothetical protein